MKKLLFSTICLGMLCVGANAEYYTGIELGSVGTKADDGDSIGNMLSVGAYIRDYKESEENSSFVKSFRLSHDFKSKDDTDYTNVNAELLLGYGMHFDSSVDFSLNILAGIGANWANIENTAKYDAFAAYTKLGLSSLVKVNDIKQLAFTLDAYFNHYIDYEDFEGREKNFFSAELGALYKFSSDKDGLYTKINVGTKDSLFSDKLNNVYFNVGLGYKF